MNLGITITSTILVLIVATPVVLMQQQQKNKERKLIKALKAFASKNNCSLTEYEAFRNFAIGLDKNKNQLFFYKKSTTSETLEHINLNEIRSCNVSNLKKPTRKDAVGNTVRLELILNPINNKNNKYNIEIYNQTDDFQINGDLEIGRKWEHIINDNIR
ncbi:hypothetical protein [Psychroserpens ponticola]|uniref:Type II secretion system protein n=1 Tax=Psychroserpens ponticola TaxID=2932268 RepID=A0ABY7S0W2_9FLAO|nr:hypothetical protein [Psychroserpens ponticola]WCO02928.1 hypothetical protein MUN68_005405 [Psychroserpens ponticola]